MGHVKLLDFGIAKLAEGTRAEDHHGILDDTVTSTGGRTQTGATLGTPAYMSPEQVRGEPVDARTDIFSLGAVLHEMLSGQRPFPGGSLVESGHAILHDDAPPLPEQVPPAVAQVVRRSLEKDRDVRIQSARDLAFALDLLRTPTGTVQARAWQPPSAKRLRLLFALAGAALLLALLLYVGGQSTRRPALPQIEQATFREGTILGARFTPEGRLVLSAAWDGQPEEVYSSVPGAVQLQALGLKDARVLGVSRTGELALMTRPHSRTRIAGTGTLARVPGSGGLPRELAEDVHFADWSPRGEVVAVRVVGANYRIERPLGTVVYETSDGWIGDLRVSPNGDHVAFVHHPRSGFTSAKATWSATSGKVMVLDAHNAARVLTRDYVECQGLAWSPGGTEVWFTAGDSGIQDTLRAAPLNRTEYEVYRSTGSMRLEDIAADGTVLFSVDESRRDISLLLESGQIRSNLSWFGEAQPVGLSDDGQLLAFADIRWMPLQEVLVLVRQTDGSPPKILGDGLALDLSLDKKTVLAKQEAGLVLLPVGAGTPRTVPTPGFDVQDGRLLRDGKRVVVAARPLNGREYRVFVFEIGSDAGPRPTFPRLRSITIPPYGSHRTSVGWQPGIPSWRRWCFPSLAASPSVLEISRQSAVEFPSDGRPEATSGCSRG
jgi:eukaryotic-like serine/threonine-protein kinase